MAASVQSICYPLVKCVYDHPLAKVYRDPIDWVADGTPDYLDVIKTPMDLGTILRKLDSHEYVDEESVRKDVDLVWGQHDHVSQHGRIVLPQNCADHEGVHGQGVG